MTAPLSPCIRRAPKYHQPRQGLPVPVATALVAIGFVLAVLGWCKALEILKAWLA